MTSLRHKWASSIAIVVLLLLFVGLASAVVFTRTPWPDESALSDPAYNLAVHGRLASTVRSPTGFPTAREIVDYDKYTYWVPPLYVVALAGWFKAVGFSVFTARFFSVLWGVILIAAVGIIAARLAGDPRAGLLALAISATDYTVVVSSTNARMDSMGAALGFAGIACYLLLRQRFLDLAILVGAIGCAAAALTHPVGALHTCGLAVCLLSLDRKNLRVGSIVVFGFPYLAGVGLWGIYIAKAPSVFLQQMIAHSKDRVGGISSPLRALLSDFSERYIFYFTAPAQAGVARLKGLVLVGYVAPLATVALVPSLRRRPGVLLTASLCFVYYCGLAVLDYSHTPLYVIYVVPLLVVLLALVCSSLWNHTRVGKWWLTIILAGFAALQVGGVVMQVKRDTYSSEYLPIVHFIRTHVPKGSLVLGSSELFFALGREYRIVDDTRLGALSGTAPAVIVTGQFYRDAEFFRRRGEHDVADHITRTLTCEYHLAATLGVYRVYLPALPGTAYREHKC